MLGFRDPFTQFDALEGPRDHGRHQKGGRHEGHGHNDRGRARDRFGHGEDMEQQVLAPRDMFHGMFSGMRSIMSEMDRHFERLPNNPNTYSYHQSSVMSYSNDGKGEPKYYQATTSTQRAPDGIKETKRAVRDSETGIHKMAVGHHIGDRGHIMEQSLDKKTGRKEKHENFLNMDESEKSSFDQEWRNRTQAARGRIPDEYRPRRYVEGQRHHQPSPHERRALPDSRARARKEYMAVDGRAAKMDLDTGRNHDVRKTRAGGRPSNKHMPREDL